MPIVRLRDIPQWHAVSREVPDNTSELHDETAYVAEKCFYDPCAVMPESAVVEEYRKRASDADWLLLPSIGVYNLDDLDGDDAVIVPFMQASFFDVSSDVDTQLRQVIGGSQLRELVRITRRAEEICKFSIFLLSDLGVSSKELATFVELQAENARKYHHPRNMFTHKAIEEIARSQYAADYVLKIGELRSDGSAVQASLSHYARDEGVFTQLVQGLRREKLPPGQNLYMADYYQLYRFAHELGARTHGLGRGATDVKKKVGANRFVDLVNVVYPVSTVRDGLMRSYARKLLASRQNGSFQLQKG